MPKRVLINFLVHAPHTGFEVRRVKQFLPGITSIINLKYSTKVLLTLGKADVEWGQTQLGETDLLDSKGGSQNEKEL
jgi:hypothetical protein